MIITSSTELVDLKVLVVDDSKLARLSLIKSVKNVEPSVEFLEAENGAIAVEVFKKEKPRSSVFRILLCL